MGAEGSGILQHDLARDVVDLFYEQFDRNVSAADISESLELQLGYSDLDNAEKEVFCGAMIECLWQVGASTSDYAQRVSLLDGHEAIRQYWGSGLPGRRSAVHRLLRKIQLPKTKPRKPKGVPRPGKRVFLAGDYIAYRRSNGRFVPIILWDMENCFGMEYYFALPNLSRVSDQRIVDQFLRLDASLTESELAGFFSQKRRFRIVALKEKGKQRCQEPLLPPPRQIRRQ